MPGPLVVLDTNVLFDDPYLRGSQAGRLFSLARRSRIELAVPEVVLRELRRQQQRTVEGRVDHLQRAEAKMQESLRLLGLRPEEFTFRLPDFGFLDPTHLLDRLYEEVRNRLAANSVEILPLPTVDHEILLAMDLAGEAPFVASGKGYRDSLIWFSIVERWGRTALFQDAYVVTNDDDFGSGNSLAPNLIKALPTGSQAVRVRSMDELFTSGRLQELSSALQAELEAAAAREELALQGEYRSRTAHDALNNAARAAVMGYIDSLAGVALSDQDRAKLLLPREYDELKLVTATALGDLDWSLYDQLDGETLLAEGSMTAEVELSAEVHKDDAAVLADADLHVDSWNFDVAEVTTWRNARMTFDMRVDVSGTVIEDVSLSGIEAVNLTD